MPRSSPSSSIPASHLLPHTTQTPSSLHHHTPTCAPHSTTHGPHHHHHHHPPLPATTTTLFLIVPPFLRHTLLLRPPSTCMLSAEGKPLNPSPARTLTTHFHYLPAYTHPPFHSTYPSPPAPFCLYTHSSHTTRSHCTPTLLQVWDLANAGGVKPIFFGRVTVLYTPGWLKRALLSPKRSRTSRRVFSVALHSELRQSSLKYQATAGEQHFQYFPKRLAHMLHGWERDFNFSLSGA